MARSGIDCSRNVRPSIPVIKQTMDAGRGRAFGAYTGPVQPSFRRMLSREGECREHVRLVSNIGSASAEAAPLVYP